MSQSGFIGSLPVEDWAAMKAGSVPDSLRANTEFIRHAHKMLNLAGPLQSAMELDRRMRQTNPLVRARSANWNAVDYERMTNEYAFSWNWSKSGSPIFMLTHSTAALLSATRAPVVDFDHAPFPAFLIGVPHDFLPLVSEIPRATRWIGVQAGALMDLQGGGMILAIPDSDALSNAAAVGVDGRLTEDSAAKRGDEWARLLGLAVRLAANVIAYVSEYRETDQVRRTSAPSASPVFEVRPPADVQVDRAFRELAAELVRARDFKGAHRALSHMVRGHWRNQPVGPGRAERKLIWIKPFRRGEESFGAVVQRTIRLKNDDT